MKALSQHNIEGVSRGHVVTVSPGGLNQWRHRHFVEPPRAKARYGGGPCSSVINSWTSACRRSVAKTSA
jgi:hypothetical protein